MYFSCGVSFASLPVFLPTILNEMGFTAINAQGLSAPPYFVAFILTVGSTYMSDRLQQRGIIIMIFSAVAATGYIILATTSAVGPRYFGMFLAAGGIYPVVGNILPWVLNNQGSDTKRGTGLVILNVVGQSGPLVGTNIYPAKDAPYYRRGMWITAAFMLLIGTLAFGLRTLLWWENKRLDRKYGPRLRSLGTMATVLEDVQEDPKLATSAGIGDENDGPNFRFVL